jgi:hypothetical protein
MLARPSIEADLGDTGADLYSAAGVLVASIPILNDLEDAAVSFHVARLYLLRECCPR